MSNSSAIEIRVQAIASGVEDAAKQLRDLEAGITAEGAASEQTAVHTQNSVRAHESLSNALGTTRSQTRLMVSEVSSLSGVTGVAQQAIMAFTTGLGPLGLAAAAGAIAIGLIKQHIDDANKLFEEGVRSLSKYAETYEKAGGDIRKVANDLIALANADKTHADATKQASDEVQRLHDRMVLLQGGIANLQVAIAKGAGSTADLAYLQAQAAVATNDYYLAVGRLHDILAPTRDLINSSGQGLLEFTTDANSAANGAYNLAGGLKAASDYMASLWQQYLNRPSLDKVITLTGYIDQRRADISRIEQLNTQLEKSEYGTGQNIADGYKQAAADASAALQGIIANAMKPSSVTPGDVLASQLGQYVDKADETIRRTRIFQNVKDGLDINKDPELKRILGLLPQSIQDELQAAFAKGTPSGKLKAGELVNNMLDFSDPRGFDAEKVADDVQKAIAAAANKKQMILKVQDILKLRGLDPNDPEVQKQLGIETGAERAMKVTGSVSFDQINLKKELDDLKKKIEGEIRQSQVGGALGGGIEDQKDQILEGGGKAGKWLMVAIGNQARDEDTGIVKQLFSPFKPLIAQMISDAIGGLGGGTGGGTTGGSGTKRMAGGGIVMGPTYALIGESGPEAVVPLDGARRGGTNINITFQSFTPPTRYDLERMKSDIRRMGW